MTVPTYRTVAVDGLEVFYREAGSSDAPTLLLLHGFPTSSHMFRDLIPLLSDRFHVVAPDLPGFGRTALPSRDKFTYSFDNLARVIGRFTEVIGLDRFALYIFDYGAPTGLRLAMEHPERITAIISQNGNAYVEGLSDGWNPIERYWRDPTQANREALRELLTPESVRWQYTHGVADTSLVSPDGYSSQLRTIWSGRALTRSSWICSSTMRATLRSTRPSRLISGSTARRFLAVWGRTIPSSCLPEPKPISATSRMPKSASSIPAISRSRHTPQRSPRRSANSSASEVMAGRWRRWALPRAKIRRLPDGRRRKCESMIRTLRPSPSSLRSSIG